MHLPLQITVVSPGAHTAGTLPQQCSTLFVRKGVLRWQATALQVYTLLSPGGRFILEPQQWVSYRKAVRKPVSPNSRICLAVHLAKVYCASFDHDLVINCFLWLHSQTSGLSCNLDAVVRAVEMMRRACQRSYSGPLAVSRCARRRFRSTYQMCWASSWCGSSTDLPVAKALTGLCICSGSHWAPD